MSLSLTDSIKLHSKFSVSEIAQKVAGGGWIRTTLFGFIPIWRPATRLERVLADCLAKELKDSITAMEAKR